MNAFCRVAPSLRLRLRAIFLAGVLLRAADFNSRTSALVQARLFEFLLAMYGFSQSKTVLIARIVSNESLINPKRKSNKSLTRDYEVTHVMPCWHLLSFLWSKRITRIR